MAEDDRPDPIDWDLAVATATPAGAEGPGPPRPRDPRGGRDAARAGARGGRPRARGHRAGGARDVRRGRRRPFRLDRLERRRHARRPVGVGRVGGEVRGGPGRGPQPGLARHRPAAGRRPCLDVRQGPRPVRALHRPGCAPPAAAGGAGHRAASSSSSTSRRATSGCGCACTRRPTGCSSAPSRGWRDTSPTGCTALLEASDLGARETLQRLVALRLRPVRSLRSGRRGQRRRGHPDPGAAGDLRRAHRAHVAARGARRRRHGRRRPVGHPDGGGSASGSRRVGEQPAALDTLARRRSAWTRRCASTATARRSSGMPSTASGWTASTGSGPPRRTCRTRAEIHDPDAWVDRVATAAVSRAGGASAAGGRRSRGGRRAALADLAGGALVLVACSGGADSLALAAATAWVAARRRAAGAGASSSITACSPVRRRGRRAPPTLRASASTGGRGAACRWGGRAVRRRPRARPATPRSTRRPRRRRRRPCCSGHTRDDQAETVLLRLARGSGARSLAAMRPRQRPWRRPLLGAGAGRVRAAAAEMLAPSARTPWDDPHNLDPAYTRVRVRALLPGCPARPRARSGRRPGAVGGPAARRCRLPRRARRRTSLDAASSRTATAAGPHRGGLARRCRAALRTRVLRLPCAAPRAARPTRSASARARVDALVTDWHGQGAVAPAGRCPSRARVWQAVPASRH